MRHFLFLLLLLIAPVSAETYKETYDPRADLEPMETIANCVNIRTGKLFVNLDTEYSKGVDPIPYNIRYEDKDEKPILGHNLYLNYPETINWYLKANPDLEYCKDPYPKRSKAKFCMGDGSEVPVKFKKKEREKIDGHIASMVYGHGYTHSLVVLNRINRHLGNFTFSFNAFKSADEPGRLLVYQPDGKQQYFEHYLIKKKRGKDSNYPIKFQLKKERLQSGNFRKYSYNDQGILTLIKTFGSDEKTLLNKVSISSRGASGIDQGISFDFDLRSKRKLQSYKAKESPKVSIVWCKDLLRKLVKPDGNGIEFDYWGNTMKALYCVQKDKARNWIYKFDQFPDCSVVQDCMGNKKLFSYHCGRIHFVIENSYRFRYCHWDDRGTLLAKADCDRHKRCYKGYLFEYDSYKNLIAIHMLGNLSGTKPTHFEFLYTATPGVEKVTTRYKYSGSKVIKEFKPNGTEIHYTYRPRTNLVTSQLTVVGKKIVLREFFEYDNCAILRKKIEDDGSGKELDDLTDVTYRLITSITPYMNIAEPGHTLPKTVVNSYLDISSGKEVQLTREEYTYAPGSHVETCSIFDSNDQFYRNTRKEYDNQRRLIAEVNPLGERTEYTYDVNYNCATETKLGSGKITHYSYDGLDQLQTVREVHDSGVEVKKTTMKNLLGYVTSETDPYGQITHYTYDVCGRKVKEVDPLGNCTQFTYDENDAMISKTDSEGHQTIFQNTAHKVPYRTIYPDGSEERIVYSLDNKPIKKVLRNGSYEQYTYDGLNREIGVKRYSPDGTLIFNQQKKYKGKNLIEEIDGNGVSTKHAYDSAGRLIATHRGERITRFAYDNMGRQYRKIHKAIETSFFDLLDRVIEERVEDFNGTLLSKKEYVYDINGNKTLIRVYTSETEFSETVTIYDSQNQPITLIDPVGNETQIEYLKSDHLEKITINPKGKKKIEIFDRMQRLWKVIEKDAFDVLLSSVTYTYDSLGNKIKESHEIIDGDSKSKIFNISWKYNCMGERVEECEMDKKLTRFIYEKGELKQRLKPDGIIINYKYDNLGRLIGMCSPDIHYRFTYDGNGNLLTSKDQMQDCHFTKTYNIYNEVVSEKIAGVSKIDFQYDQYGRRCQITSSDFGTIDYEWKPSGLASLTYSQSCQKVCTHDYISRDMTGRVKKMQLIGKSGTVTKAYDKALRPISIHSDHYQQSIGNMGYDPCNNLCDYTIQDAVGIIDQCFDYDALDQINQESGVLDHAYRSDSLRRRSRKDETSFEMNDLGQVTFDDQGAYTYDPNGNLIKINKLGVVTTIKYDSLDRLVEVVKGDQKINYYYDSENRRLRSTEGKYLYIDKYEVGIFNTEGKLTQFRLLGEGIRGDVGATVAIMSDEKMYAPIHDWRGNIVTLLQAESGAPEQVYRYSAFGEERVLDPVGNHAIPVSPWRFSSKRTDSFTEWSYFGERYYSPMNGRWLTPDPLGFPEGPNLYGYVGNNPLVLIDSDGLFAKSIFNVCTFGLAGELYRRYNPNPYMSSYEVLGNSLLGLSGIAYFGTRTSHITHVDGHQNPYYGNGYVNGMSNFGFDSLYSGEHLSQVIGGQQMDVCVSPSFGPFDLVGAILGYAGVHTPTEKMVEQMCFEGLWQKEYYILHCHSKGAIHTNNTLRAMDEEMRSKVFVVAIAPAELVDPELCGGVVNICSSADPIPYVGDGMRMKKFENTIQWVTPKGDGWKFFDHSLKNESYINAIKDANKGFYDKIMELI